MDEAMITSLGGYYDGKRVDWCCQAVSVAVELHCDSQPLGLVFDSAGMVVAIDPGASSHPNAPNISE